MGKRVRNNTIDLLRFLAAFAVVYGHCGCKNGAVLRFAVPLFFAISGYFYCNISAEKKSVRIKKTFELTLIANLGYALVELVTVIFSGELSSWFKDLISVRNIFETLVLNKSPFGVHLWFLSALLFCMIIDYFISKFKPKKGFYLAVVLGLIAVDVVYILFLRSFSKLYLRNFLLMGMPYFYIGKLFADADLSKLMQNKHYAFMSKYWLDKILAFVLIAVLTATTMLEREYFGKVELYFSTPLLVLTIFVFALTNPGAKLCKPLETLAVIGRKYSLAIYISHHIYITLLNMIFVDNNFKDYPIVYAVCLFILTLLISMLYYNIKGRIVSKKNSGKESAVLRYK